MLQDRVIYVPHNDEDPRLEDGAERRARSATLSHCWSGIVAVMTKQGNPGQHRASLPLSVLPKTFRDAVLACRSLGILYLWIDSICISQDSAEDWETQSAKMGSIYHESTVTLAAAGASNSTNGLFVLLKLWDNTIPLHNSFGGNKGQHMSAKKHSPSRVTTLLVAVENISAKELGVRRSRGLLGV